jgi:hypothetical protein
MIRTTTLSLGLLLVGAAATVSGQEALWAPAFRGTSLRRLEAAAAAAAATTYTGRGDLAGGVTATRGAAPEADVEAAVEIEARGGTGAQSPKGYSLVEDQPRCYFTLGSAYCAQPGGSNCLLRRLYPNAGQFSRV